MPACVGDLLEIIHEPVDRSYQADRPITPHLDVGKPVLVTEDLVVDFARVNGSSKLVLFPSASIATTEVGAGASTIVIPTRIAPPLTGRMCRDRAVEIRLRFGGLRRERF
jgi:hypothetical protein